MLRLAKSMMNAAAITGALLSITLLLHGSAAAQDWASIPGKLVDVSVAPDGTAAGVNSDQ